MTGGGMFEPLVIEIFDTEPDAGFWLYRASAGGVLDKVAGPFATAERARAAVAEAASRC